MAYIWDEHNISHIAEHNVTPDEVEQVIDNGPYDSSTYFRNGEERRNHLGETNAGRVLALVTTQRGDDTRVVTAFPPNRSMRKQYAAQKERDG